jgi:hypothetical protein
MCSPVTCSQCGKQGWRGCGAHVEQILGHLPKEERCQCREKKQEERAAGQRGGILDWLLGSR